MTANRGLTVKIEKSTLEGSILEIDSLQRSIMGKN